MKETQEKTKEFVLKEHSKQKKYEDELAKIQAEFEQTREKDEGAYDAKVKHEVQFAIVGLAEKRYKAEAENVELKRDNQAKQERIAEMERQIEVLRKENAELKQRMQEIEIAGGSGGAYKTSPKRANDATYKSVRISELLDVML